MKVKSESEVAQSCLNFCDPMDGSTLGFPVHHQLPELAQTHVRQLSDAINHLILSQGIGKNVKLLSI